MRCCQLIKNRFTRPAVAIFFFQFEYYFVCRLFGTSGNCAACCKVIPAFEMVMRAKSNVYHLDCFACQQCHQRCHISTFPHFHISTFPHFHKLLINNCDYSFRFCVGDRFYLAENRILCEYDYEERMIFANMSSNSTASLAHIQRRVTDIQVRLLDTTAPPFHSIQSTDTKHTQRQTQ